LRNIQPPRSWEVNVGKKDDADDMRDVAGRVGWTGEHKILQKIK
jgi:hypothetical protein